MPDYSYCNGQMLLLSVLLDKSLDAGARATTYLDILGNGLVSSSTADNVRIRIHRLKEQVMCIARCLYAFAFICLCL